MSSHHRASTPRRIRLIRNAALAVAFSVPALADTATWLAPASGTWSDPAKWSTNPIVPNSPSTDALLSATGSFHTVTLDTAVTLNSLSLTSSHATLLLTTGGSITTTGGVTVSAGSLSLTGGTLTGGPITAGPGATINLAAAPLSALPSASTFTGATLGVTSQTHTIADFRALTGASTATYRLGAGAVLDNTGDTLALPSSNAFLLAGGKITGGTLSSNLTAVSATSTLDNTTLASTLTLTGIATVSATPSFTLSGGIVHVLDRGSLALNGGSLTGTGQVVFDGLSPTTSVPVLRGNTTGLTIGPDITIRTGQTPASTATIGTPLGSPIINHGTISAETPGSVINIFYSTLTNTGTLRATNNAAIRLFCFGNSPPANLPNVATSNGGAFYLGGGTLQNTGNILSISSSRNLGIGGGRINNGAIASADATPFTIHPPNPNTTVGGTLSAVDIAAPVNLLPTARLTLEGSTLRAPLTGSSAFLTLTGAWSLPPPTGSISLSNSSNLTLNPYAQPAELLGPITLSDSAALTRIPLTAAQFSAFTLTGTSSLTINAAVQNTGNDFVLPPTAAITVAGDFDPPSLTGGTVTGGSVVLHKPYFTGYAPVLADVTLAGTDVSLTPETRATFQGTITLAAGARVTLTDSSDLTVEHVAGAGEFVVGNSTTNSTPRLTFNTQTTIPAGITIRTGTQGAYVSIHSSGTIAGTVSAETPGKTLSLWSTALISGTVRAVNGGTLQLPYDLPYDSNGRFIPSGHWSISDNSAINHFYGIRTIAAPASVTLAGPNSSFTALNSLTRNLGSLTITDGRSFVAATDGYGFTNSGSITIGPGSTLSVRTPLPSPNPSPAVFRNPGTVTLDAPTATLLIDYPGARIHYSPVADVRQQLLSGHITTLVPGQTIGYVETEVLLGITLYQTATYAGQAVDGGTLILKPTLPGDANLDGAITPDDYTLLDKGFLTSGSFWWQGDFNYDGIITPADYLLIDSTFLKLHPPSPTFLSLRESQFGPDYVSNLLTTIPEPSLALSSILHPLSSLSQRAHKKRRRAR